MPMQSPVLQFRVELLGIEPPIWRRIQVPGEYSFWDLHVAIQSAFGWNDSHLHEFRVTTATGVVCFGLPTVEDCYHAPQDRPLPDWKHQVADLLDHTGQRIDYCYDFGDDWQHSIIFEEALTRAPGKKYPRCTAGERSAPPDDCGGLPGYESLLEILADPTHEEYQSSHRWAASIKGLRGKFHPEAFDEQAIKFANPALRLRRVLDATR